MALYRLLIPNSLNCAKEIVLHLQAGCRGVSGRLSHGGFVKRNPTGWRMFSCTPRLLNAAKTAAKEAVKANRPKIRSDEVQRLIGLAKPEKYRLAGKKSKQFSDSLINIVNNPFAGGIGLLFVSSAITMVIPFALGKVIDIIYGSNQESMIENLTNVSLILVGVFIFGAACNFGRTYLMGVSGTCAYITVLLKNMRS